jgi:hypothetical protein
MLASSSSQVVNQVQFNTIRRPIKQYATPLGRRFDFCLLPSTFHFNLGLALVLLEMFHKKEILLKRISVVYLERTLLINCSYITASMPNLPLTPAYLVYILTATN